MLIKWLAAFWYLAERGDRREGVIVNSKYVRNWGLKQLAGRLSQVA